MIENRENTIGIFGLGYVGLPLSLTFCRAGSQVVGFDIDPEKIAKLNAGQSYIQHIGSEGITESADNS